VEFSLRTICRCFCAKKSLTPPIVVERNEKIKQLYGRFTGTSLNVLWLMYMLTVTPRFLFLIQFASKYPNSNRSYFSLWREVDHSYLHKNKSRLLFIHVCLEIYMRYFILLCTFSTIKIYISEGVLFHMRSYTYIEAILTFDIFGLIAQLLVNFICVFKRNSLQIAKMWCDH